MNGRTEVNVDRGDLPEGSITVAITDTGGSTVMASERQDHVRPAVDVAATG